MTLIQKFIISLCIAGASSCFTLVIYREINHKEAIYFDGEDDSDLDYNELSFQEGDETFTWEVIEDDDETFIFITNGCDEDFYKEIDSGKTSKQLDRPKEKLCYIYKYPKKIIHLI